jgi:hypothetical protein
MSSVSTPRVPSIISERRLPVALTVGILAVITAVAFVLQLRHFSPFMTDDAYISLRYSQRLIEGHGLTWNDTRPVEGYTNFLWVLICAGLGALGMPLPLSAHLLGITTSLLILVVVVAYVYRHYPEQVRSICSLIACCAMVLSSPFSMWALGGLEQPLLACMLVGAAYLMLGWLESGSCSFKETIGIGMLLGLACLSRADAALFTAAFFAAAVIVDFLSEGFRLSSVISRARILPLPILFFASQLAFRRSYYHEWLPNTAFVKVAFTAHRVHSGLRYLYFGLKIDFVFLVLAVMGSWALWRAGRKKTVAFLWTIGIIWTAYLVVIGGDIFPAERHFEPLVALFGFLVAGCGLLSVDAFHKWKPYTLAGLLALTVGVATSDAMTDQEHWEEQGKSLGLFLHQAFGDRQPLLSSDAAGVVPFFAHIPVLDPLGLNDYHIAHEASRTRGYGWVGHELGDGKYILDQKPDLLLFSSFDGTGEMFPADRQIVDDPRFAKDYQAVHFDTPGPNSIRALMYLRRTDGKLGIQNEGGKIVVPGYLETTDPKNSIHLVDGKATLVIAPNGNAVFEKIPVPAGDWTVSVSSDHPDTLSVGEKSIPCGDHCSASIKSDGAPLSLVVENHANQSVALNALTLTPK